VTDQEPQPPDPNEDPELAAEIARVQANAATPPVSAPAPATTAEFAQPAAASTLQAVPNNLKAAMAGINTAKLAAASWTDEFWAVSGYSKDAVMAALTNLEQLSATYYSDYDDEAAVLLNNG
jgi:hypothetical protein